MSEPMLIPLTRGYHATVDAEDYDRLTAYKWHVRTSSSGSVYPIRKEGRGVAFMHRHLLSPPAGMHVDHINGDPLDNRRCNLRLASCSQNQMNRGAPRHNTSGFKGVAKSPGGRPGFRAYIKAGGVEYRLGTFDTALQAALSYNIAAVQLHGQFARLNDVFSGGAL